MRVKWAKELITDRRRLMKLLRSSMPGGTPEAMKSV